MLAAALALHPRRKIGFRLRLRLRGRLLAGIIRRSKSSGARDQRQNQKRGATLPAHAVDHFILWWCLKGPVQRPADFKRMCMMILAIAEFWEAKEFLP
jgi:hypothetical protein